MEWPLLTLIIVVACLYIVPKLVVFVLCLVLRKFSFYASVGGPLTLNDLMLRIPLKMNWAILFRVEQISIKLGIFPTSDKLIGIYVEGLQVNLMLRDDFEKWTQNNIEILDVIKAFHQRLSRLGLLKSDNSYIRKPKEEDCKVHGVLDQSRPNNDAACTCQEAGEKGDKLEPDVATKDWSETIKGLLDSSTLVLNKTKISFFVYKMDGLEECYRNIDEVNIQMFYQRCLLNKAFQKKYNCMRIFLETAQANFVRLNEDDFEVLVKSPQLLIVNSKYEKEYGQLTDVELGLKIPRRAELVKDFCNWELNAKIQSGKFDISKGFIKSTITFFVMMDTLASIYKEINNLIYKQHFQDIMFLKLGRDYRQRADRIFENHRDADIPKKIKLTIIEPLEILIAYPSERLAPFLAQKPNLRAFKPPESLKITLGPKTIFEMTIRINKTYFLQFESPNIDFEQNGYECAKLVNFKDTIDFAMKQEKSNFFTKSCPLELNQLIQADKLEANLSPSLMKHVLELMNYYRFGVARASIKHKIFMQIQDPNFLQENIIERKHSELLDPQDVLDMYELEGHLDKVRTKISIKQIDMSHSSHEVYSDTVDLSAKQPGSYASDFKLAIDNFSFKIRKEEKNEEMILRCTKFILGQANRMSPTQREQNSIPKLMPKDYRPLSKGSNFAWQQFQKLRFAQAPADPFLPFSDRDNYKIVNQRLTADGFQLNIDFEFLLDRTQDILDYSFISKHFSNKWQQKYPDPMAFQVQLLQEADLQNNNASYSRQRDRLRPRRSIPWREVIETKTFYIKQAEVIWNLSRSRMLVLQLEEFRPTGTTLKYFNRVMRYSLMSEVQMNNHEFAHMRKKKHSKTVTGQDHIDMCCSLAAMYYSKQEEGEIGDSEYIEIMNASELRLALLLKDTFTGVGLDLKKFEVSLPHDLILGGLMHEIDKQIMHVPAWYRHTYINRKRELNFTYQQLQQGSDGDPPLRRMNNAYYNDYEQPEHKRKKPWRFDVTMKEFLISVDDAPMMQMFTNHDEIVEMMSQRQVFLLASPREKLTMLKNLKKSGAYQKYFEWRISNLNLRYEMPDRFNDPAYCMKWIQGLDEAHQFVQPKLFEMFDANYIRIRFDYFALHGRSIFKPVFEIWGCDQKLEIMNVLLNSKMNPGLFQVDAFAKIFHRFSLPQVFNKIPKRTYYLGQVDYQKIKINIQGQQTLLFLNDLTKMIDHFTEMVDMSKSIDPRIKKLPVLGGTWDQLRTMRRGSGQIKVKDFEIEVWPKRNFNRYSDRLLVQCSDLQYNKRVVHATKEPRQTTLKHDLCLRSLYVRKEPLKQFETALVHFPLIELSVSTSYNKGKNLDHYNVLQARDYDQYVQLLRSYSTKELTVQVKLNIPSLGTINSTREKSLYLPLLLQSYVANSPVPIVNYQRSYMKFLDEILQEYVLGGKVDISGSVKARRSKQPSGPQTSFKSFQLDKKSRNKDNEFRRVWLPTKSTAEVEKSSFAAQRDVVNGEAGWKSRCYKDIISSVNQPILDEVHGTEVTSRFCLQVQTFLHDMMILFTDYDETTEEFKLIAEETEEQQTIEPDLIDDDGKRDEYLSNYQGILFTTENLSFATTILIDITNTAQKFQSENSFFKNTFLCLHTLNSSNLFEIRNKKLDHLRKKEYPNTIGNNYQYFCRFFGIDKHTQDKYKLITREFKTIFPSYVLMNEFIQHAITSATGGYKSCRNAQQQRYNQSEVNDDPHRTASLFRQSGFGQQEEEDLNFRDCDTFAMIELMEYRQNCDIAYNNPKKDNNEQNSNCSNEPIPDNVKVTSHFKRNRGTEVPAKIEQIDSCGGLRKTSSLQDAKSSNKGLNFLKTEGTLGEHLDYADSSKHSVSGQVFVKHLIDVKNVRFLYTKHVYDMIHHHLVSGFDYTKYRKTDYIDVEKQQTKKRSFLDGYLESEQNYMKSGQNMGSKSINAGSNRGVATQKEAYIGLRLINPQINMQDGPSKAQALINCEGSATCVIFAYSEPEKASASAVQITKKYTKEGGKWNTNIVKHEICLNVDKMNIYVAPTYINLEKPTFWRASNNSFGHKSAEELRVDAAAQALIPSEFKEDFPRLPSVATEPDENDQEHYNTNALRKVLSFTTVALKFVFLDDSCIDHQNPLLDIDFQLNSVNCQMDGPSMQQFLGVFKSTFLDRGEKSADLLLTEEARAKDLKTFKLDKLRDMIHNEVQSKMGLIDQKRPIFSKRVSYAINECEFSFFNLDTKFASGKVEQANGKHWIYATRESKNDIDIEKLSLYNHLNMTEDGPTCVLSPHGRRQSEASGMHVREAMFKLRTRDKFVVVSQAPWRVFDQYEIFIYPTNIQLTYQFYHSFKHFIFDAPQADTVNEMGELQDHYDNLISTKALDKINQSGAKPRASSEIAMIDNLSDKSKKQKRMTFIDGGQKVEKSKTAKQEDKEFQSFFRYLRINEIQVQITYIHSPRSSLNVHQMPLRLNPFIIHGKFQTMQQVLTDYEKHCKSRVLRQTPSLIKKLIFKGEQLVADARRDDEDKSAELQLHIAKRLLFGDLAYGT